MRDGFAQPLCDSVRVIEAGLAARDSEPYWRTGAYPALPRYGARKSLQLVKSSRPEGRHPHDHPARRSQPKVCARDGLNPTCESDATNVDPCPYAERLQLRRDDRLEPRS